MIHISIKYSYVFLLSYYLKFGNNLFARANYDILKLVLVTEVFSRKNNAGGDKN